MRKWGYVLISIFLFFIILTGCSNSTSPANTSDASNKTEKKEKRTDFGDDYIEEDNIVAFLNEDEELYMYSHAHEEEHFIAENVEQYDLLDKYIFYLTSDGTIAELDIPLQAIHRVDIHTKKDEKMLDPKEKDDSYVTPRDFFVNKNGYIAIKEEVGFFYSNYWHDYYVTDINFTENKPIYIPEDGYDFMVNDIQWQGNDIYFLVDRGIDVSAEDLHTELHAFSMKDGTDILQERSLPLSQEAYQELVEHTVYIGVEDSILYISAVDDDHVEKIAYEIDLETHEVIYQSS